MSRTKKQEVTRFAGGSTNDSVSQTFNRYLTTDPLNEASEQADILLPLTEERKKHQIRRLRAVDEPWAAFGAVLKLCQSSRSRVRPSPARHDLEKPFAYSLHATFPSHSLEIASSRYYVMDLSRDTKPRVCARSIFGRVIDQKKEKLATQKEENKQCH